MQDALRILQGDCLEQLRSLPTESVQCCVTSPPYWNLRDYGVKGQIGLEKTPEEFVSRMVAVFQEVKRVLKKNGTLWVNMGDCYAGASKATGLKPKDICGMPWRVAFALQADGWYLRSDIIWHKPNPMPESIEDRPTKAHEYIFLLSKSAKYFYDAKAIKEPVTGNSHARGSGVNPKAYKMPDGWDTGPGAHGSFHRKGREKGRTPGKNSRIHVDRDPEHAARLSKRPRQNESFSAAVKGLVDSRNKRTVWTVATEAFKEAHFATFPTALIKPCILAGAPAGGVVLDPFGGSGTTGAVAIELGRKAVLIELNPAYVEMIKQRCAITPGLGI